MNKETALDYIASMLAIDTANHVRVLRDLPFLKDNTNEVVRKNREAAIALDIDGLYSKKLEIHMQGLWDLLKTKII